MEVRGLPEPRHTLMFISEKMRRIGDLATKLKFVYDDINKTDEIKIYRDKFHLPDNESINIIETGEEIIVYRKAKETEFVEKKEDKKELLDAREEVLKGKEAILKEKEGELQAKIDDLEKRSVYLQAKEKVLEKKEKEIQLKEKASIEAEVLEAVITNQQLKKLKEVQTILYIGNFTPREKKAYLKIVKESINLT